VAVDQWRRQFLKWTNLPEHHICTFTGAEKNTENMRFSDSLVVITTYHMVAYNQKRSKEAESAMEVITSQEWGCVLLDEVHVAPANKFRRCINLTHSRCKIGLTATLVREDDLIDDLYFMVGPKLYEANWLDLSASGYIAKVECLEVSVYISVYMYDAAKHQFDSIQFNFNSIQFKFQFNL
jgi:DNA excision repair protein ERCC-3